jgi:hypothetical protein
MRINKRTRDHILRITFYYALLSRFQFDGDGKERWKSLEKVVCGYRDFSNPQFDPFANPPQDSIEPKGRKRDSDIDISPLDIGSAFTIPIHSFHASTSC